MLASGHGQSGRGIMCTVTSFVSCLFIFTFSQLHDFSQFLLSFLFTGHYKHLFYISHIPPFLFLARLQVSQDTACPLLLLCVRVISKI